MNLPQVAAQLVAALCVVWFGALGVAAAQGKADSSSRVDPVLLNLAQITSTIGYPEVFKQAGIEGVVTARVLVGKNGEYLEHVIVNEGQVASSLVHLVEAHLPKLKFQPGLLDGKPVKVWVTIPFTFKLGPPKPHANTKE